MIQTDSGGTVEHAAVDPARLLAIGEGPERLRAEIGAVLDRPREHPEPVAVVSQSDQAAAFIDIANGLLGRNSEGSGFTGTASKRRAAAA